MQSYLIFPSWIYPSFLFFLFQNLKYHHKKSRNIFTSKYKAFIFKIPFLRWCAIVPLFNSLFRTSIKVFFWELFHRTLPSWNKFKICIKLSAMRAFPFTSGTTKSRMMRDLYCKGVETWFYYWIYKVTPGQK